MGKYYLIIFINNKTSLNLQISYRTSFTIFLVYAWFIFFILSFFARQILDGFSSLIWHAPLGRILVRLFAILYTPFVSY